MRCAVLCLVAASAFAAPSAAFNQWMTQYGKAYSTSEERDLRYAIWEANLAKVNTHNAKGLSWTLGMNEYADMTSQEFAHARIGRLTIPKLRSNAPVHHSTIAPEALPKSVDWRTKGVVTPVKNQGQCGSCWSFSATGATESASAIATGNLISLSEQQLVDCSGAEGNEGCNGGWPDWAFEYIISNKGLCTEAAYPYTASDGTCVANTCTAYDPITAYTDVTPSNDLDMATAVVQQPVSVCVQADQNIFQLYTGGVVTGACGTQIDHAILAVGYNVDSKGTEYWIVKNSWGATWGLQGYIYIGRGEQYNGGLGECGIYYRPSYPTV